MEVVKSSVHWVRLVSFSNWDLVVQEHTLEHLAEELIFISGGTLKKGQIGHEGHRKEAHLPQVALCVAT